MLPNKINIKTIEVIDGDVAEVETSVFIIYNYNSRNAFLKANNLKYSDFGEIFKNLLPNKDKDGNLIDYDINKTEDAGLKFGQLTYFAIAEGMRMVKQDFKLTEKDVLAHLNADTSHFMECLLHWSGTNPASNKKKVAEEKA